MGDQTLYPVYHVQYSTNWARMLNAVVAAQTEKEAFSQLEIAIRNDDRLMEETRRQPDLNLIRTKGLNFRSDRPGAMYWEIKIS